MLRGMVGTPRERARAETMSEIVRIGRAQLVESGPASLSLRAVARRLGVVSSAVYRYVRNRDELLTLLVVDAYEELGDTVDAAVDAVREPNGDGAAKVAAPRARFFALGRAVRAWALSEPSRYALLYGTPVPGYEAPADRTTTPGTRVIVALVGILACAGAGSDRTVGTPIETARVPASLAGDFARIRSEYGWELSDDALARAVLVWSALFGAVSFEVFGQYGADTFTDPDALFELHLAHLADVAGL